MKRRIVFLTGAGMSVESGFKTFRGQDGLWENEPVERIATHEGWLADPDFVNQFYNNMRRKLYQAQPNEGHRLIAVDLDSGFEHLRSCFNQRPEVHVRICMNVSVDHKGTLLMIPRQKRIVTKR